MIKPKFLVIVILVLVALFVFSAALPSGGLVSFRLPGNNPLKSWLAGRNSAVSVDDIALAGDENTGCAWNKAQRLMIVPPGVTCRFDIQVHQRSWYELGGPSHLNLRLVGPAGAASAGIDLQLDGAGATLKETLEYSSARPQPYEKAKTTPPSTPTPRPTPTPVQLTVYDDPDTQTWNLILSNCQVQGGEGSCQVELVK